MPLDDVKRVLYSNTELSSGVLHRLLHQLYDFIGIPLLQVPSERSIDEYIQRFILVQWQQRLSIFLQPDAEISPNFRRTWNMIARNWYLPYEGFRRISEDFHRHLMVPTRAEQAEQRVAYEHLDVQWYYNQARPELKRGLETRLQQKRRQRAIIGGEIQVLWRRLQTAELLLKAIL